jgi:hypothetical protein
LHGKGGLRCHRARDRLESMHTSTAYRLTIRLATKQPSVRYRVSSTGRISLMRWAALRTQCRESSLLHTRTFCGDDYPRRCRSGSAPEPVPFLSPLPPRYGCPVPRLSARASGYTRERTARQPASRRGTWAESPLFPMRGEDGAPFPC